MYLDRPQELLLWDEGKIVPFHAMDVYEGLKVWYYAALSRH